MYQNTDHAREAYGRAVHTYTEAAEELTNRSAELISHLVRDHWADAFVLVIEADTTDDGIPTFWARAVLDVNRLTISDESNADTGDYFTDELSEPLEYLAAAWMCTAGGDPAPVGIDLTDGSLIFDDLAGS